MSLLFTLKPETIRGFKQRSNVRVDYRQEKKQEDWLGNACKDAAKTVAWTKVLALEMKSC